MTSFENDQYAPTSWGETSSDPFEIVTPSGQRCLARKLEMEDVLAHGLLNELDSFTSNLLEDGTPQEESPQEVIKSFQDQDKFQKLIGTVNKIILITILKPTVYPVPESTSHPITKESIPGARIPGRVYVDRIGFMDKMAIFEAVFEGMKGLDRFRQESKADLGTVENVEAVSENPELSDRNLS